MEECLFQASLVYGHFIVLAGYTVSMMTSALVVHIFGGIATGIAGSFALVSLYNRKSEQYRVSAIMLGTLATFEICTGALLSVISQSVSAGVVCERVALYLALVALLEIMLFIRMRDVSIKFPFQVVPGVAASVSLLATAFALGF